MGIESNHKISGCFMGIESNTFGATHLGTIEGPLRAQAPPAMAPGPPARSESESHQRWNFWFPGIGPEAQPWDPTTGAMLTRDHDPTWIPQGMPLGGIPLFTCRTSLSLMLIPDSN